MSFEVCEIFNFTRPVCGFPSATFTYPAYIICVMFEKGKTATWQKEETWWKICRPGDVFPKTRWEYRCHWVCYRGVCLLICHALVLTIMIVSCYLPWNTHTGSRRNIIMYVWQKKMLKKLLSDVTRENAFVVKCLTLPCHQPKHQFNFLRWVASDRVISGFKLLIAVTL